MAEFLIMARPHWRDGETPPTDPEPLAKFNARSQKGDIVVVKPDGWAWGAAEGLPDYILVKVPTISYATAMAYQARVITTDDPPVLLHKYRFHVPVNAVDAIIALGGVVTRTTNQFTGAVLDKG